MRVKKIYLRTQLSFTVLFFKLEKHKAFCLEIRGETLKHSRSGFVLIGANCWLLITQYFLTCRCQILICKVPLVTEELGSVL